MACVNIDLLQDIECPEKTYVNFGQVTGVVENVKQYQVFFSFEFGLNRQSVQVSGTKPVWLTNGCTVTIDYQQKSIHMEKEPKNLVEGLTDEILRVTEISKEYKSIPGGSGMLAAKMMDTAIEKARKAQGSGDILEMMPALKELQEFEL